MPDRSVRFPGVLRVVACAVLASTLLGPASAQSTSDTATDQPAAIGWLQRQLDNLERLFSAVSGTEQSGKATAQNGARKAPSAPVVTASRPITREVVEWDEYTGRIDAMETVEVRARVPGYLQQVHFKDGQLVAEGDLLYTIDPRPFERVLETARAELQQARVKAQNAARDVERGRPLLEKGWLSQRVFEERDNLLRDTQAAVAVAEARVKTAELELSFTRITAPIAGRMGRTMLTVGNYVSAGLSENSSMLTTIVRQDPVYVYFDIGESNALKYKRFQQSGKNTGAVASGAMVFIGLQDETEYPHKARLDFSDNRLDRGTGTLRVRAVLDNKAGLFQPGMFARIRIAGSPSYQAVMIPDEAIGTDQASKFVYIVDEEGTAHRKWVQLGPVVDGLRVVKKGVAAEDWVIVRGIQRARPDEKVAVRREPLQVSAAPAKPLSE